MLTTNQKENDMFKKFIDRILDKVADKLAERIKNSDQWSVMIKDIAEEIDVADLSRHVDASDVANYVDIDYAEVAENVDSRTFYDCHEIASEVMQKIVSKLEALV
jgi:hypothetical protein